MVSPQASSFLAAVDLHFAYGDLRAVAGISVDVGAGEFVAVLGPNGSGKSTLLRLLAGILAPDHGSVSIAGQALDQLPARARARRIAVVPQALQSLPEIRVRDFVCGGRYAYLSFWRSADTGDRRAVDQAMQLADVADCGDRLLCELSGGQRQRVLIARALAQAADLMLFDEPTVSLDPEHQIQVARLVRDLASGGKTVVFVTHDLNLASQFADRVVLLDAGRKVADGSVEAVLCESVLAPVYGRHLLFSRFPGEPGRPLVLPFHSG